MSKTENTSKSSGKMNTVERIITMAAGIAAIIGLPLTIYATFFLPEKSNIGLEPVSEPSPAVAVTEPADTDIYGLDEFNDDDARLAYSADLIGDGRYRDAVDFLKSFQKAVESDSEIELAIRFNLGLAYLYREDWSEAVNNLDIVAKRTNYPDAYYNLGLAYMGLNQPESALDAFDKALRFGQKPEYEAAREAALSGMKESPAASTD